MTCQELLDIVGNLTAHLKTYRAKLPDVVHLAAVPGGLRPTPELIDAYERSVTRFREHVGKSAFRRLTEQFLDSLEAFEGGKLLTAIQPLLAILDHLEGMQRDKEITVTPAEEKRIAEYRAALHKILPGNQPELEGAGRGL